jgi:trimeric autotransporter adhesin
MPKQERRGMQLKSLIAAFGLLLVSGASVQQYAISTFAGGAPPPTPSAAVTLSISRPVDVAADTSGNVYFTSSNCVFKLDQNGVLTRVAGNSRSGYSGDGGPATSAQLNNP